MASRRNKDIAALLLSRHGCTWCEDLGIDIARNTPSPLFRWLCASLLFSARIGAGTAASAVKALAEAGWTTPEKMAAATWEERTRVLNRSGYARYDESTSRRLGAMAERILERYGGDLRRLRDEAERDPAAESKLLQAFDGIGPVGAAIFCREAQLAWDELYPFADRKALEAAGRLGLGRTAGDLAALVDRPDLPRLVAALVRASLADDLDALAEEAAGG